LGKKGFPSGGEIVVSEQGLKGGGRNYYRRNLWGLTRNWNAFFGGKENIEKVSEGE